ncbi:MAG: DUF547 domain-containing protein [Bacteroidota bacterium]
MKLFFACTLFVALACQPATQNVESSQTVNITSSESESVESSVKESPLSIEEENTETPTKETTEESLPATQPSPVSVEKPQADISPEASTPVPTIETTEELESIPNAPEEIPVAPEPMGISHTIWNSLVSKYVTRSGKVNYKGFISDKANLQSYLELLSTNPPTSTLSPKAQLAYWINAYNAFTVKLIIDNYPLKSITDLGEPWDKAFINIGGKTYTLNQIEHEIIRKQFKEPRIHFAVNCASISCPKLLNEAYTEAKLEAQLTTQTKSYLNNPAENVLSSSKVELSSLFDWYKEDFTKSGSVIDFVNTYANTKVNAGAVVSYKEYNWALNE